MGAVPPLLLSYGGKYVTSTEKIDLLEGEGKSQSCTIVEFPSREKAMGFYNSAEYAPYKEARLSGSEGKFMLIDVENGES
ncbi:DUF1330 domain-containing protein [Marinomonas mediterranea]|nr:DUF1330 domain-containing protein [Marinomonas mediterranea]